MSECNSQWVYSTPAISSTLPIGVANDDNLPSVALNARKTITSISMKQRTPSIGLVIGVLSAHSNGNCEKNQYICEIRIWMFSRPLKACVSVILPEQITLVLQMTHCLLTCMCNSKVDGYKFS